MQLDKFSISLHACRSIRRRPVAYRDRHAAGACAHSSTPPKSCPNKSELCYFTGIQKLRDCYKLRSDYMYVCLFIARCTIVQSAVLRLHVVSPSICPSVCDVGGSWPHRLKILENNCTNNLPNNFTLRSPKVIHLFPREHGGILGRKCLFNIYVHNDGLNWVNRESRDLRWRCGCLFTFVSASRGHLCDITAFLYLNRLGSKRSDLPPCSVHSVFKCRSISSLVLL